MLTRVKICCVSSIEESRLVVREGAHAVGLVSSMPSGPGVIDCQTIRQIADDVPPSASSFLLTAKTAYSDIVSQVRATHVQALQFVNRIEIDTLVKLKNRLPGVKLVQVIHVLGDESIEDSVHSAMFVDAILLDSGNPNSDVRTLGGTGRAHDWRISRIINDAIDTPVFLAGGLDSSNVSEAIETVRPFAVDVCTGVRTNGCLDSHKLSAFMNAVRTADVSERG